jgi:hypothetical protein
MISHPNLGKTSEYQPSFFNNNNHQTHPQPLIIEVMQLQNEDSEALSQQN